MLGGKRGRKKRRKAEFNWSMNSFYTKSDGVEQSMDPCNSRCFTGIEWRETWLASRLEDFSTTHGMEPLYMVHDTKSLWILELYPSILLSLPGKLIQSWELSMLCQRLWRSPIRIRFWLWWVATRNPRSEEGVQRTDAHVRRSWRFLKFLHREPSPFLPSRNLLLKIISKHRFQIYIASF